MTRGASPRIYCAVWAAILASVLVAAAGAVAAPSPAGRWTGEIKALDGKKGEIHIVLSQRDGAWTGSVEDPLLGTVAATSVKVTGTGISFAFKPDSAPFPLNFSGSYIAGDDRVTGTFSLQGHSSFVKFKRADAGAAQANAGPSAPAEPAVPVRIRHPYRIAVNGRVGYWSALHAVRDETYKITNLTTGAPAFGGGVKWFVLDGFSLTVRGLRGGQKLTGNTERLAAYETTGLTADSYLSLDGVELGLTGYLGNKIMSKSMFNPYVTAGIGRFQWSMNTGARGTDPIQIELVPVESTDWAGFFGIGTEYELGSNLGLEADWVWRVIMTADTDVWRQSEDLWGHTLIWSWSAGVTYGF